VPNGIKTSVGLRASPWVKVAKMQGNFAASSGSAREQATQRGKD
jgi:hypothetical protein